MKYQKDLQGLSCNMRTMMMHKGNVTVMITSDELGKTMSVSDGNTMITIPLEKISDVVRIKEG